MVYPLLIESKEERLLYQLALEYRHRKSLESEMSLERHPPSSEESGFLHKLFLLSMNTSSSSNSNGKTEGVTDSGALENNNIVYMKDTIMSSCHFCQPQERNIHQFMFGGTLMRKSFELAVATATLFVQGRRHALVAIDEFHFKKSVPLGSILRFTSMVVHTGPELNSRTFQIRVLADVLDPLKGGKTFSNTNVFYLTFEVIRDSKGGSTSSFDPSTDGRILPLLVPRTYEEAMLYLEAKRRRERGILLSRRHSMDYHDEYDQDDDSIDTK